MKMEKQPIPKPRRFDTKKSQYENVLIDFSDKRISIIDRPPAEQIPRLQDKERSYKTYPETNSNKLNCDVNQDKIRTLNVSKPVPAPRRVCNTSGSYENTQINSSSGNNPWDNSFYSAPRPLSIDKRKSKSLENSSRFQQSESNKEPQENDLCVKNQAINDDEKVFSYENLSPGQKLFHNLQKDSIYGKIQKLERKKDEPTPCCTHYNILKSDTVDLGESQRQSNDSLGNIFSGIKKCMYTDKQEFQHDKPETCSYSDTSEIECSSSPEPIYANQIPVYGALCEIKTKNEMLNPQLAEVFSNKCSLEFNDTENTCLLNKDILYEFDPLANLNINPENAEGCSELVLLENLFQLETYGVFSREKDLDSIQNLNISDEENGNDLVMSGSYKNLDTVSENHNKPTCSNNQNIKSNCLVNLEHQSSINDIPIDQSCSQTEWFVDVLDSCSLPLPIEQESRIQQHLKTPIKSFSNVLKNKIGALKRKGSFRSSGGHHQTDITNIIEMIPKPPLSNLMVQHEGHLLRLPSRGFEDLLKEMQNRKGILRNGKFQMYLDSEMKIQKESFPLENIISVQCVNNHKFINCSMDIYCFEVSTAISKNQPLQKVLSMTNLATNDNKMENRKLQHSYHLYGVAKEFERDLWMQKIIQSLTDVFPNNYTCQYYRAGWSYLKNSITSQWEGSWILLQKKKRRLMFYGDKSMNLEKMDLRKARCIVLKENDESIKNLYVKNGPLLMIDCPPHTIYLIMSSSRETINWRNNIREVSHTNGPSLNEQQLTKHNVPVLIDKCINFIYIHGSMSEGIYRKSGSENSIQKLISLFRTDAFNVEITRNEYNEHDVANVLKRFMRELPQKLLDKYSSSFISITQLKSKTEKLSAYKEILTRLSNIEYQTLKKIIGHLAFIQSQKFKNKMGIDNLAIIWGPTLLQNKEDVMTYSQKEADVISDLICLYKNLYQLSPEELNREQQILSCLNKYYSASESLSDSQKKSGDLKCWINIDTTGNNKKEEYTQINIILTPTKTAYEICNELASIIKIPAKQLTLNEIILDGSLERPLHHNEKVLDIVLRWSYWPETDRKNNYLVVRPMKILFDIQETIKNLPKLITNNIVKFADNKTKNLKLYNVQFKNKNLLIQKKEKDITNVIQEIPLNNITAYLGCEKKRNNCVWAITILENNDKKVLRSREFPYIGHILAGNDLEDQILWFSNIWYHLHGKHVMPP